MPVLVEHAPCKEAGNGAGSQVPGQPCGLTNLPRGQSIGMLAEEGNNDATALLHIGSRAVSPEKVLVFAHLTSLAPYRHSRSNRAGLVAVYLTVC
jgi:hypothetical protein